MTDIKSELGQCRVCGSVKEKERLIKGYGFVMGRALRFLILKRKLRKQERYRGDSRDFTYFVNERNTLYGMLIHCIEHPEELHPGTQIFEDIKLVIALKLFEKEENDDELDDFLESKSKNG